MPSETVNKLNIDPDGDDVDRNHPEGEDFLKSLQAVERPSSKAADARPLAGDSSTPSSNPGGTQFDGTSRAARIDELTNGSPYTTAVPFSPTSSGPSWQVVTLVDAPEHDEFVRWPEISILPPHLIICLERFHTVGGRTSSRGVITHHGSETCRPHYVAYVTKSVLWTAVHQSAYVLFHSRWDAAVLQQHSPSAVDDTTYRVQYYICDVFLTVSIEF
ncbi:hypothetical protein FOZ60_011906 [Perkinsus olseni]|uniref:Uncharacterized protein n=1 Tax=Perkinsus olseni TaxID=32597 RepID=A0A7J6NCK3_PEROL|nr:hypothetical protein FOZ60_011906 [Perkinsus olseni]